MADLDAVLFDYMEAEGPHPSHESLMRWIAKYPEFSQELTDLTVAVVVYDMEEQLGLVTEPTPEESERLIQLAMKAVNRVLDEQMGKEADGAEQE